MTLTFCASVFAGGEGWTDNVTKAMEQASKEGKDLLMNFTGSDWCGWCIKLKEEVFSKEGFKDASKNFVLVELDFPRTKQLSDNVKKQNAEWAQKLGVSGYPTIMLVDAKGITYAKTGYRPGGAEAYVKHLNELRMVRVKRDAALTKAALAKGIDKAKQLDAALSGFDPAIISANYSSQADEIIKLDADNGAGLKNKYLALRSIGEIRGLLKKREFKGAIKKATDTITEMGAKGQTAQDLYLVRSEAKFYNKDKDGARKDLDLALQAAPNGSKSQTIKGIISRVFKEK